MANIRSQIKRNHRAQRERFENRQYTSQIKTYFRRLETAVSAGDGGLEAAEVRLDGRCVAAVLVALARRTEDALFL